MLNEATNALDAQNERVMLEARSTLHGRITMLVIAHQRSTIRSADHIIRLVDGRLVEATRAAELSGRSGGSA